MQFVYMFVHVCECFCYVIQYIFSGLFSLQFFTQHQTLVHCRAVVFVLPGNTCGQCKCVLTVFLPCLVHGEFVYTLYLLLFSLSLCLFFLSFFPHYGSVLNTKLCVLYAKKQIIQNIKKIVTTRCLCFILESLLMLAIIMVFLWTIYLNVVVNLILKALGGIFGSFILLWYIFFTGVFPPHSTTVTDL